MPLPVVEDERQLRQVGFSALQGEGGDVVVVRTAKRCSSARGKRRHRYG
jgi:hypothetical protein